jgi:hypothetical protein
VKTPTSPARSSVDVEIKQVKTYHDQGHETKQHNLVGRGNRRTSLDCAVLCTQRGITPPVERSFDQGWRARSMAPLGLAA